MSISLYRMDFVGPINPLPQPRTLGGMAHGTQISGIGVVQWIFHTGATTLIIDTHCYHVPNNRACLLIPQRLFNASGGSTGTFNIGENYDTLSLDGKPSLGTPYDYKSYLPVYLTRNSTNSASPTEVNKSVIYNENKTILLHQSFFLCGTKILVTETCSPSKICFDMFIHSPPPSLQELKIWNT